MTEGENISHSKPFIDDEDIKVVQEQVASGLLCQGNKTKEFENKVKDFISTKYAKAVTSGTIATHLALVTIGVKGGEVIMPSYICQSIMSSVEQAGAKPILADIDSDFLNKGYNISARTIKPLITEKTKAIFVAHMFGIPAKIDEIRKIAQGIPIIEDCAQAIGSKYNGKYAGTFGDMSIFSFYATKIISSACGGMILTDSGKLIEKINDLTQCDQREEYKVAYNYRLSDIQAALGISQLGKLNSIIERRNQIAKKYNSAFIDCKFKISPQPEGSVSYRYPILTSSKEERNKIRKKLKEKNIICETPVFRPLHRYLKLDPNKFKNTDYVHDRLLSLPLYPSLTREEVERVIKEVKEFHHNNTFKII